MDRLPPEVLSIVAGYADPTTASNFMCASKAMWEIGARGLYHDVHLNKLRLRMLLTGGRKRGYTHDTDTSRFVRVGGTTSRMPYIVTSDDCYLPERTRRALRYTQHLTIDGPLATSDHHLVWAAGIDAVLFPNVRTLQLTAKDKVDALCAPTTPFVATGALFGPHLQRVCVQGSSAQSLLTLSSSKHAAIGTYVLHWRTDLPKLMNPRLAPSRSWDLYRAFDFRDYCDHPGTLDQYERESKDDAGALLGGPVQIVAPATPNNVNGLNRLTSEGDWNPTTSLLDLRCEDYPDPCELCGEMWMDRHGNVEKLSDLALVIFPNDDEL